MSWLRLMNSGVCWYLAKSSSQSAWDSGGRAPISGFHSTMDSPEWGQARDAAHHHGDEHHGAAGEQPPGHGALRII
jgi:hypothetical protein